MFCIKYNILISIILLVIQVTTPVFADIFKCESANGQTVYSSKKCAKTAKIFIPKRQSYTSSNFLKKINTPPAVDIYITSWCPYCKKAMNYLHSKNITFNTYDIEKSQNAKLKKKKLAPDYAGVPLTLINGKLLKGFSEKRFNKALAQ